MKLLKRTSYFLICILFLSGLSQPIRSIAQDAEQLDVQLRDGCLLTVNVDPQIISWTNVLEDGQMTTERIDLADVERLWITNEPASEQVANVRQLLVQLGDDDYHKRELAETLLADSEIGGPYLYLIELQKDHPVFEVRYRINRILKELNRARLKAAKPTKFDRLELKNGRVLDGDIGDFQLRFKYAGQNLEFGRDQLLAIGAKRPHGSPQPLKDPVSVNLVHDYTEGFYVNPQRTIKFDTDPDGDELKRMLNVSEVFSKQGIKFSTESKGYIGISGYEFKFAPEMPPSGNSICVFETSSSHPKRFKGVLEVRFCVPGKSRVAAGVNEFGLVLARVNHNRDFIMEAYSSDGHILGAVEATDQPCIFLGVKSNEPIAFVRVLSNPYLHRVSRSVDEDYAVDDVCFSTPAPIDLGNSFGVNQIQLRNGDQFIGKLPPEEEDFEDESDNEPADALENIAFTDKGIRLTVATFDDPIEVPFEDIREIRLANKDEKIRDSWSVMLADRSVLRIESKNDTSVQSFPGEMLDSNEVAAMTLTQNKFRFPLAGDFESGNTVLVFPTCRIATNSVSFEDSALVWEKNSKKLIQPIYTKTDKEDDDDPTPADNRVELEDVIPSDVPSIWYKNPRGRPANTGILQLTDGQQFVLGSDQGFKLANANRTGVKLSWRDQTIDISWRNIKTVQFLRD